MTMKRLVIVLLAVIMVFTSIGINPQEVSAKNPTNKITFKNGSTINLYAGEYANITVDKVYSGGNCTYNSKTAKKAVNKKEFNYSPNKKGIVTVSRSGKITAKKNGTVKITVTSIYSSKVKGTITVKVGKAQKPSIKLKSNSATIGVEKTVTIKVNKLKGVSNTDKVKGVKFTSGNKKIATVNSKGVVKGKKAGKTTITVTSRVNAKVSVKFTVNVKNNDTLNTTVNSSNKKKAIVLEKTSVELAPESSFKYWQNVQGNNPEMKIKLTEPLSYYQNCKQNGANVAAQMLLTNKEKYGTAQIKIKSISGLKSTAVKYKSSNSRVATVSNTGKVTPKKAGTAVITVTSKDDKTVSATYTVTVKKYVTGFDFMMYTNLNDSWQDHLLYVCALPSNAANQDYVITSSDESIIKVDNKKGAVAGMKKGKATLTLKSKDGKCKISWECTVSSDETTCWGWRGMGEY